MGGEGASGVEEAFVGIGSNIDRARNVRAAVSMLRERFGALALSSVWESEAVGFEGPPFYNLVAAFATAEAPSAIVEALRGIEDRRGRDRDAGSMASRTLDLDLLLLGDRRLREPGLELPRPEVLDSPFVLVPLAELAPHRRHPVDGRTFAALRDAAPPVPGGMHRAPGVLDAPAGAAGRRRRA